MPASHAAQNPIREERDGWVVCQIGAREHYAVARALHRAGRLAALVTDAWARPGAVLGRMSPGLAGRFHPDLDTAYVLAPRLGAVPRELTLRARHRGGWPLILARNAWFQRMAVRQIARIPEEGLTVFAYSYAAREIFAYARSRGWRTVLGQIDPGPVEERLVADLHRRSALKADWQPAPSRYWDDWRAECDLADVIVVNSAWSRDCLMREGIPANKLAIVPLALEAPPATRAFRRTYPKQFSADRPMRVLFLGQINLRKGIEPLFDAIRIVGESPIEFWFVGPLQVDVPPDLRNSARVRWFGPAARSATDGFYRDADVFVLPTFSDGFGLTQLEARAWHLPVLASRFCGEVVEDGRNGALLAEVTGPQIAAVLGRWLADPGTLSALAAYADGQPAAPLASMAATLLGSQDAVEQGRSRELIA